MRLKRLELAGFKSFVDPTRIEFGQGITAIVGPNGCGKSNIVDALRWVLGEHSARHLRGGVMDDLIFQGSDTRPPVAICDVELTFAIEKGTLASPYHEMNEISIRRRLTRDGGSDAFINGKMARLKDIVDLFLDTGISTRAYAIVEQGSIARMVTSKPDERRLIFEEAAGVMKYRSRRREAERRMKDTRQNLDRAIDLLEEVRSQCRSLKQQASRAERFKKLQDEFSRMQSVSLGLRYQELQAKFSDSEQQLTKTRNMEAETAGQLAAAEKTVSTARERLVSHENEAQVIQDQLREAERQRADLQQQAERMAGERRLLTERKITLQGRIEDAQQQLLRLSEQVARLKTELADQNDAALQAQKLDAMAVVETAYQHYQQAGLQRDALLAEYERLRQSSEQAEQQKRKAEQALLRLADREQQLNTRLAEVKQQTTEHIAASKLANSSLAKAQQNRQQHESDMNSAQQQLDHCRAERESAMQALSEKETGLRELKGLVQELRGRTKNQDVSDAFRDALRAQGAIWMDESLDVPEGLEAAVAAALRGRSADVRIPANPDLQSWQHTLSQAADTPIALFGGNNPAGSSDKHSLAHAIGLQADHPLFDVFAPVLLIDDITDGPATGAYCVSRSGWRYEPNGWLIPPAGNRTAERIATQRQLRDREADMLQADSALTQANQHFMQAEATLKNQQEAWQQAHLSAARSESEYHAAEALVERLQTEGNALQERQQRLQSDLRDVIEERGHWQSQMDAADDVDMARISHAKIQLDEQNERLQSAEQALNQARSQLAQAEQALALFAQARDNLNREHERLLQEQDRLNEQQNSDATRLQQAENELSKASSRSNLDQALADAANAVDAAHQAMNAIRQAGHELQQTQHEAERAERLARQQQQLASEQRQGVELTQAQEATRMQDVESEILHRCQLSAIALLNQIADMEIQEDAEVILNRARELEERLGRFGPVNLLAIEEYDQAFERENFLAEQAADLEASLDTLADTINRIDRTTKQRFYEVFQQTNAIFQKTFPQLFGGGRAELRLDSDDILTAGVEVIAQPPGKCLQDIGLLSGGEKALTAVALVFSIFKIKPAPFCVLDEVDAPLDDANVGRYGEMVRELSDSVQFLSITHNKITMQQADRLIGVSMPEPGVSRIVAVDMESVPA
jgi:chromosome segregation protein